MRDFRPPCSILRRLPLDAMYHVASFLELKSLLRLRVGCRSLLDIYDADSLIWKEVRPSCLAAITARAAAPALRFLNYLYQLKRSDVNGRCGASALYAACIANDITKINWLTKRFCNTIHEVSDAVEGAARMGNLASMHAVVMIFGLFVTPETQYTLFVRILLVALRHGRALAVRWLLRFAARGAVYTLAPNDMFIIFRTACQGPNLLCLIDTSATLRVSRGFVRANERLFLGDACFAGMAGNVQWLVLRFRIRAADLRESNYTSVRRACEGNFFWLASMLVRLIRIEPNDIYRHMPMPALAAMRPHLCRVTGDREKTQLAI